jgi:hypothetical protein
MASQKPARPAWLQRSHEPPQADSQQEPSTQKFEPHSALVPQAWPWAFLQTPSEQVKPLAQSPAPPQVALQPPLVASQAYAPQSTVPLSTQVPLPSQVSALDAVPAEQLAAAQTVDAGWS